MKKKEECPHCGSDNTYMSSNGFDTIMACKDCYAEEQKFVGICKSYTKSSGGWGPSRDGSPLCRMGTSIASGGTKAYCTCAACF